MKLLLIDGFYYAYRSFHAMPDLRNARDEPTGATHGFIKSLRRVMADVAPDAVSVIWDEGLPERRTTLLPEYKQQRDEMPMDLQVQLFLIRDLVEAFGVKNLSLPGTEADDLMASYAIQTASSGGTCIIASSDKDVQQVVTENILIYSTLKHDLPAPDATFGLLGPEAVERKWGVPPALLGDLLSLTGDSSDNIPGVPGVGPKGAAALLTKYGSLDAVLTLPPDLPEKMRLKLSEHGEAVRRNREMVRLDLDLPLPLPPEALIPTPDATRIRELAEAAGLRSLAAEFGAPASPKPEPTPKRAKKSPPPAVTPSPDSPLQGELF